ncbi:MAG TPA: hypothetical protein VD999_01770 [Vitreimonas sp.]|nr:hypothetical protein [Vitreimonas sp.]
MATNELKKTIVETSEPASPSPVPTKTADRDKPERFKRLKTLGRKGLYLVVLTAMLGNVGGGYLLGKKILEAQNPSDISQILEGEDGGSLTTLLQAYEAQKLREHSLTNDQQRAQIGLEFIDDRTEGGGNERLEEQLSQKYLDATTHALVLETVSGLNEAQFGPYLIAELKKPDSEIGASLREDIQTKVEAELNRAVEHILAGGTLSTIANPDFFRTLVETQQEELTTWFSYYLEPTFGQLKINPAYQEFFTAYEIESIADLAPYLPTSLWRYLLVHTLGFTGLDQQYMEAQPIHELSIYVSELISRAPSVRTGQRLTPDQLRMSNETFYQTYNLLMIVATEQIDDSEEAFTPEMYWDFFQIPRLLNIEFGIYCELLGNVFLPQDKLQYIPITGKHVGNPFTQTSTPLSVLAFKANNEHTPLRLSKLVLTDSYQQLTILKELFEQRFPSASGATFEQFLQFLIETDHNLAATNYSTFEITRLFTFSPDFTNRQLDLENAHTLLELFSRLHGNDVMMRVFLEDLTQRDFSLFRVEMWFQLAEEFGVGPFAANLDNQPFPEPRFTLTTNSDNTFLPYEQQSIVNLLRTVQREAERNGISPDKMPQFLSFWLSVVVFPSPSFTDPYPLEIIDEAHIAQLVSIFNRHEDDLMLLFSPDLELISTVSDTPKVDSLYQYLFNYPTYIFHESFSQYPEFHNWFSAALTRLKTESAQDWAKLSDPLHPQLSEIKDDFGSQLNYLFFDERSLSLAHIAQEALGLPLDQELSDEEALAFGHFYFSLADAEGRYNEIIPELATIALKAWLPYRHYASWQRDHYLHFDPTFFLNYLVTPETTPDNPQDSRFFNEALLSQALELWRQRLQPVREVLDEAGLTDAEFAFLIRIAKPTTSLNAYFNTYDQDPSNGIEAADATQITSELQELLALITELKALGRYELFVQLLSQVDSRNVDITVTSEAVALARYFCLETEYDLAALQPAFSRQITGIISGQIAALGTQRYIETLESLLDQDIPQPLAELFIDLAPYIIDADPTSSNLEAQLAQTIITMSDAERQGFAAFVTPIIRQRETPLTRSQWWYLWRIWETTPEQFNNRLSHIFFGTEQDQSNREHHINGLGFVIPLDTNSATAFSEPEFRSAWWGDPASPNAYHHKKPTLLFVRMLRPALPSTNGLPPSLSDLQEQTTVVPATTYEATTWIPRMAEPLIFKAGEQIYLFVPTLREDQLTDAVIEQAANELGLARNDLQIYRLPSINTDYYTPTVLLANNYHIMSTDGIPIPHRRADDFFLNVGPEGGDLSEGIFTVTAIRSQ